MPLELGRRGRQNFPDLNSILWEGPDGVRLARANRRAFKNPTLVDVHFENLEKRCVEFIDRQTVVVGCVAWLTNRAIIRALAKKNSGVSIVVQKETSLRDGSFNSDALRTLKATSRHRYGEHVASMFKERGTGKVDAVRCMGYAPKKNGEFNPFPRMHHKFIVGCRVDDDRDVVVPQEVWVGSFNLTANASRSLENAIVLQDPATATAFYDEWIHILSLSEEMDWRSRKINPQFILTNDAGRYAPTPGGPATHRQYDRGI